MYQYENHKNEKGLQRKLKVLYPKRRLLSLVIAYYLIKKVFYIYDLCRYIVRLTLTTSECVPFLLSSHDNACHITRDITSMISTQRRFKYHRRISMHFKGTGIKTRKDYRENWKFSILKEDFFHSLLLII
jgi:hypothetical protein